MSENRNTARIVRDTNGMVCGAKVNYLYDLKTFDQNHESFMATGKVPASPAVNGQAEMVTKLRDEEA